MTLEPVDNLCITTLEPVDNLCITMSVRQCGTVRQPKFAELDLRVRQCGSAYIEIRTRSAASAGNQHSKTFECGKTYRTQNGSRP